VCGRRVPIQIIGDILSLDKAGKTEIGLFAGVGYQQLESYLSFLLVKGFLERYNHGRVTIYRVTARGQELLQSIDNVTQALEMNPSRSDD